MAHVPMQIHILRNHKSLLKTIISIEIEEETWFLQTLEKYYEKLNLKEFTQKYVQSELYKNYWGQPYSEHKQRISQI